MQITFRKVMVLALAVIILIFVVSWIRIMFYSDEHNCGDSRNLLLSQPMMQGYDVEELQLRLRHLGYYQGDIHGFYDSGTAEAVRAVQKDLGVAADGVATVEFWHRLWHLEEQTQVEELPPPQGEIHIEIYLHKLKLTVFSDGEPYVTYPISPGRPATPSPMGEWRVVNKSYRPNDAFGTRWMRLSVPWGGYGVHGTNAPWSIGTVASLGCIRMYNRDVEVIYPWIPIGTRVIITGNYQVEMKAPMRPGRVGQDVVLAQWALRDVGFCPGEANGTYGKSTENAVKELQRVFGLEPTGILSETEFWLLNLHKGVKN